MQHKPAENIDDAYHCCHPEIPLEPGDPRYVDLTAVRGGQNLVDIIERRITRTRAPQFHKQVITGHRGCGKSTELKQLQARLRQEKYFAIYVDVENVLDLADLNYLDVLVALARAITEACDQEKLHIRQSLLQNLEDWFAERLLTQEEKQDVEGALKAEFAVDAKIPLLTRMLVALSGQIRSGSSRKIEIRQRLERELPVLLSRLNELIDKVQVRLQRKRWRSLVVIVDGLEKMHYRPLPEGQSTHSALFVEHAEQLKAPNCHVIYTVPISLLFNVNLGDSFAEADVVPMVKINESDGEHACRPGRDALKEVVRRRATLEAVFESEEVVERIIEASGGSIRDLLRLVRFACDETDTRISAAHANSAVQKMVREYDRLVKDEDLPLLQRIRRERQVPGDEASARLLHHRLVLEYINEKRWADLHPAVCQSPRVQKVIGE